jgi:hypothetical protein
MTHHAASDHCGPFAAVGRLGEVGGYRLARELEHNFRQGRSNGRDREHVWPRRANAIAERVIGTLRREWLDLLDGE